jgi:hypothetical protein
VKAWTEFSSVRIGRVMNIRVSPQNTGEFLDWHRILHLLEKDCCLSGVSCKVTKNEILKPDVKFCVEIDHRRACKALRGHLVNDNILKHDNCDKVRNRSLCCWKLNT